MKSNNLGIDLGYGFVKATDGKTDYIFPSVVGSGGSLFTNNFFEEKPQNVINNLSVNINGNLFFVGDLAIKKSQFATRSLWEDKIRDNNTLVLFLTAVGLFANSLNKSFNIVTGLPTACYNVYKDQMKEKLLGKHNITFNLSKKKEEIEIKIDNVEIVPQPYGTFINEFIDEKGNIIDDELKYLKIGIIDVGFKTTDFLVVNGFDYIERLSDSIQVGISNAYRIFSDQIKLEYNFSIENYKLDAIFKDEKLKIYGKEKDVSRIKRDSLIKLAQKIIIEAKSLWEEKELDRIYITGGGGIEVSKYLLDQFNNAYVVNLPQFANVKGFAKLCNKINKTTATIKE